MSPFAHQSSGAPTFTAASASLSLSGLDEFSPVMDPNLLDSREWYHDPGENHRAQLSPQHEHYGMNFSPGFPSHSVAVSHDSMHRRYIHLQRFRAFPSHFPLFSPVNFISLRCHKTIFPPQSSSLHSHGRHGQFPGVDVYQMSSFAKFARNRERSLQRVRPPHSAPDALFPASPTVFTLILPSWFFVCPYPTNASCHIPSFHANFSANAPGKSPNTPRSRIP